MMQVKRRTNEMRLDLPVWCLGYRICGDVLVTNQGEAVVCCIPWGVEHYHDTEEEDK